MPTSLITAAELAQRLHGEVLGDGSVSLTGFAPADTARAGDLTFAENEDYLARAEKSNASAVLVGKGATSTSRTLIRVDNPRVAFARQRFLPCRSLGPVLAPTANRHQPGRL